jgi:hypothetical protein
VCDAKAAVHSLKRSVVVVKRLDGRGVDTLCREEPGTHTSHNESQNPAENGDKERALVDAASSLENAHTSGGTDLAVSGGERDAEVRAKDDDDGGTELDREPARRCDLDKLDTDGADDLVSVNKQTEAHADTTDSQDPVPKEIVFDELVRVRVCEHHRKLTGPRRSCKWPFHIHSNDSLLAELQPYSVCVWGGGGGGGGIAKKGKIFLVIK